MQEVLEKHHIRIAYSETSRRYDLATLGLYLQGKPDNEGWRELLSHNGAIPIPKGGRIYPHWALLDLYKLMEIEPGIETRILYKGNSLSDLPTIDETVEAMSRA